MVSDTAVYLVGSHTPTIPNLSSYRVTKYPNETYRCTCRNFIFNRQKENWPEDKHITDVKAKADNVSEITNPDMKAVLIELEKLSARIEAWDDYGFVQDWAAGFRQVRDVLIEHAINLTAADQAYLMTEITGAEIFWIRYDQKRREQKATAVERTAYNQLLGDNLLPKKKEGVYFL